jgi:hypothetical protein
VANIVQLESGIGGGENQAAFCGLYYGRKGCKVALSREGGGGLDALDGPNDLHGGDVDKADGVVLARHLNTEGRND